MSARNDGTSPYLLFCVLVASMMAFQYGYNSGVINQPRQAMTQCRPTPGRYPQNCIPMDDWQWGAFVSIFLLGGVFGGLSGGHLASSLGRRRVMLYNNFLFILGTLCLAFGQTVTTLCLGRFVVGWASGIGTVVVPLYISEISPANKRGILGSFNQLAIVIGILVSVVLGIRLATRDGWRLMFGFPLVICVLQVILVPFCVETPNWLASQALTRDAKEALQKLRASDVSNDELTRLHAESEEDLETASETPATANNRSFAEVLAHTEMRKPIFTAVALHVIQQFSGINAAIYYSTTIFTQSYSPEMAMKLTVGISIVNLIMTVISALLIDRVGRRTLLLVSEAGMAACAGGVVLVVRLGAAPAVIVGLLIAFVASFAVGLGVVTWVILPELVPASAVGTAASLGIAVNWSSAFLIAFIFPSAVATLSYDVFFIFASILVAAYWFTAKHVPETRGKTAQEIARAFALHVE